MAVVVGHGVRSDLEPISMSNGLMSVFIGVLTIAASSLARNDYQRKMAVWLASHDQGAFGLGAVDFDVSDYPWERATFDRDKEFLLSVIQAARSQHEWSRLGYKLKLDWILDRLEKFEGLVRLFLQEHVKPTSEKEEEQLGTRVSRFELCPTHGVCLHSYGCVLCNDA